MAKIVNATIDRDKNLQIPPVGELAKDPANWKMWPVFLVPFTLIGFALSMKIWNALPKKAASPTAVPAEPEYQPGA